MLIPACKRRSLPELDGRCGGNGERPPPLACLHCHNIGAPSAGPTQNSTRMPIPSLSHDALRLSMVNAHCFIRLPDSSRHEHGPLRRVKISFSNLNAAYITNQHVPQPTKQNKHRLTGSTPTLLEGSWSCFLVPELVTDEEGPDCTISKRHASIESQ